MLLVQQLRKGSGGLVIKLHEEADQSFEERKNAARKRGEEISTKLLIPMFMMLGVVLVILLVPACMTMQIS